MTSRTPRPDDSITPASPQVDAGDHSALEESAANRSEELTWQAGLSKPTLPSSESTEHDQTIIYRQNPSEDSVQLKLLGRFRIESQIGRGGFGAVYVAHDPVLDRKVAIKVPRSASTSAEAAAFLSEARRLAQLKHPGIVAIHDVGEQDGLCYIVTEFLEGRTLSQMLEQSSISWRDAVALIAQIAEALGHAHAQSIVHRDIKPGNIFITADGRPVLLDFGLGMSDSETAESLDAIVGTPTYMSPEQARGEAHRVDGRTDIFSLGAVLYRMLCGRPPFRAGEIEELIRKIVQDEPQPMRQLNRDLPPELDRICLQALSKRQSDRFTTAGDFASALRALLVTELSPAIPAARPASVPARETSVPPSLEPQLPSGSQRSASRRRRPAEKRRVTLVAMSMELLPLTEGKSFDAERQHELLQEFEAWCRQCVGRFEAAVVSAAGQTLSACFGFPRGHEDSAHRAVRAGLELIEWGREFSERVAKPRRCSASVWAVVHTGEVVAEETGSDQNPGVNLVGDVTTIVARLEQQAIPGAVTITAATNRIVAGHFEVEPLGMQRVRGVIQPVELFQVSKAVRYHNRVDLVDPGNLTPLIGRDTELSVLKDRWELALEEQGQVVLLIGDAGLGKSRLIRELREYVDGSDAGTSPVVIEFRGSAYHQNTGFFPAIEFLSRMLQFEECPSNAERLDRVARYLRELELETTENVALMASLLSLSADDRYPPLTLTPQRQKERIQDLLLQCLQNRARQFPVLFIVEDLHWIDPSMLELLGRHVEGFERSRLMSVFTFRPEFQTPWRSYPHQTQIALNRLTKRQIGDMMRRKTGRREIPEVVIQQIVERTDGVPLFIEEFTNVIMESGVLDRAVPVGESSVMSLIPASLQDLLVARLDRMESNPEVVQLAATIGREFSYQVLSAACDLPEQDLQEQLDKLIKAELLFQKGKIPDASYIFKHALIQDSAYQSMLKKARRQFHGRIADVLETRFPDVVARQPELLAQHFVEAGESRRSVDYWLKAGQNSQRAFANREAIEHFRKGLAAVATLPESPERDGLELGLQASLSTSLLQVRGYAHEETGHVLQRARELAVRLKNFGAEFGITWGIWAMNVVRGRFDNCVRLSEELLEMAAQSGDPGFIGESHYTPLCTSVHRGEFQKAWRHFGLELEHEDLDGCAAMARQTGQNSAVESRVYAAFARWALGYPDQARRLTQQGIEIADRFQDPFSLVHGTNHSSWTIGLCGDAVELQKLVDRTIRISEEQPFPFWAACGRLNQAFLLNLQGKPSEAIDVCRRGMQEIVATGAEVHLCRGHAILAESWMQLGKPDRALAEVATGLELSHRYDELFLVCELLRLRGVALSTGPGADFPAAHAAFREALDVARRQESKSFELRILNDLCRSELEQGQRLDALRELSTVFEFFTEGFETTDLRTAKSLLDHSVP